MLSWFARNHRANERIAPNSWERIHNSALFSPRSAHEKALCGLLSAWAFYAQAHKDEFHQEIGKDGFLGEYWQDIGRKLIALLNGEKGRLDSGTLERGIRSFCKHNGLEIE